MPVLNDNMDLHLRPSDIRFTQNKIASEFRSGTLHEKVKIGQTLDSLLTGHTKVADIPKISVCYRHGEWYSVDNRRLWIFQKLEKLGKCTHVPVKQSKFILNKKFSTKNGGKTVILRRDPGGQHCRVEEELLEVKTSLQRHFESQDSITSSEERPNVSEDREAPRTHVVNDQQEKPLSTTASSESSVTIKMSERVLTENLEGKSVSGKLPSDADKIERIPNETQGLDGEGDSLSGTLSRKSIKNTPGTALTSESREDVVALQQKSNNNVNLKGKPLNTVPASNLEVAPLSTLLSNKSEEQNKIEHKTLDQEDVQTPKIVSSKKKKKKKKKKEVKQTIAATNSVEIPTAGTNTKKERLFLGVCPLLPTKSQCVEPVQYSNTHSIPTSNSPYCVQNGNERLQDIDFRLACLGLSRLCSGPSHYHSSSLLRSRAT